MAATYNQFLLANGVTPAVAARTARRRPRLPSNSASAYQARVQRQLAEARRHAVAAQAAARAAADASRARLTQNQAEQERRLAAIDTAAKQNYAYLRAGGERNEFAYQRLARNAARGDRAAGAQARALAASTSSTYNAGIKNFSKVQQREISGLVGALKKLAPNQVDPLKAFYAIGHDQRAALVAKYRYAVPALTKAVESENASIAARAGAERQGTHGLVGVGINILKTLDYPRRAFVARPERVGVYFQSIIDPNTPPASRIDAKTTWDALSLTKRAELVKKALGQTISPTQAGDTTDGERFIAALDERMNTERLQWRAVGVSGAAARIDPASLSPVSAAVAAILASDDNASQEVSKAKHLQVFSDSLVGSVLTDPLTYFTFGASALRGLKSAGQVERFIASETGASTIRTFAEEAASRAGNYRALKALFKGADDEFIQALSRARSLSEIEDGIVGGLRSGSWSPARTRLGFASQLAERAGLKPFAQGFRRPFVQALTRGRLSVGAVEAIANDFLHSGASHLGQTALRFKHGLSAEAVSTIEGLISRGRALGIGDEALRRTVRETVIREVGREQATLGARGLRRLAQPEVTRETIVRTPVRATLEARKRLPGIISDIKTAEQVLETVKRTDRTLAGLWQVVHKQKLGATRDGANAAKLNAVARKRLGLSKGMALYVPKGTNRSALAKSIARTGEYAAYGPQARKIAQAEVVAVAAGLASPEMVARVRSLQSNARVQLLFSAVESTRSNVVAVSEARRILQGNTERIIGHLDVLEQTKKHLEQMLALPPKVRNDITRVSTTSFTAKALAGAFHVIDSIHGAMPASMLKFERRAEASLNMSRWARAMHLGADIEDSLANAMNRAGEHGLDAARNVRDRAIRHVAVKMGVDQTALLDLVRQAEQQYIKDVGVYTPTGERLLHVASQLQNYIFLPDPLTLRAAGAQLKNKKLSHFALRNAAGLLQQTTSGLTKAKALQSRWKFRIITGMAGITGVAGQVVGVAAGVGVGGIRAATGFSRDAAKRALAKPFSNLSVLGGPNVTPVNTLRGLAKTRFLNSVKAGGAVGFAAGATLGGTRYIMRVVGIEETMRAVVTQGSGRAFLSRLPFGLGDKLLMPTGLNESERALVQHMLRLRSLEVVSEEAENWTRHSSFKHSGSPALIDLWDESVPMRERVEAYSHVVNNQIRDDDPVVSLLTKVRFGTREEKDRADAYLRDYLSTTGKQYSDNLIANVPHFTTVDDIIEHGKKFVDEVLTHPSVVAERKAGLVSDKTIRALIERQQVPRFIHGTPKEYFNPVPFKNGKVAVGRYVLSTPTNVASRLPYFKAEYYENLKNLLANGVPLDTAAKRAADRAVETANEIMFRLDGTSRFARKVDLIAPFQQVREELPRVYGKILREHPFRVLRATHRAAQVFNQATNGGVFYQDATGDWRMRVPGSARLSRLFGGPGTALSFRLRSLSFVGGGFGFGILPTPGGVLMGPLLSLIANAMPDRFPKAGWAQQWLYPYGSTFQPLPRQYGAVWTALMHTTPPWMQLGRDAEEESMQRFRLMVARQYLYEVEQGGGRQPSDDEFEAEVNQRTKSLLLAQAALQSMWPAAASPVYPLKEDFDAAIRQPKYRKTDGSVDWSVLLRDYPEFQPLLTSGYQKDASTGEVKFSGPEEFWNELQNREFDNRARFLNQKYFKSLSVHDFYETYKEAEAVSKGIAERHNILLDPDKRRKNLALYAFDKKNPQVSKFFDTSHMKEQEFASARDITDPDLRNKALDSWRFKWKASRAEEDRLLGRYYTGALGFNAWANAREPADVYEDYTVSRAEKGGALTVDQYAATHSPAEAIRLYEYMQMLEDTADGAKKWRAKIAETYNAFPELLKHTQTNPFEEYQRAQFLRHYSLQDPRKLADAYYENIARLSAHIAQLKAAKNEAAKAKNWKVYYSLKSEYSKAQAERGALQTKVFAKYPDWDALADTMNDGWFDPKLTPKRMQELNLQGYGHLALTGDEKLWERLSDNARIDFVNSIKKHLDDNHWYKFEWLSPFARSIFESNFGLEVTRQYMRGIRPGGVGSARSGFGKSATPELDYAYSLMKKYNKRSGSAPAGYAEYRRLSTPQERIAFLQAHPEVRAWVSKGPLANMPPLARLLVTDIMVRHGKWSSTGKVTGSGDLTYADITEIAWAQQQLERWTRRKKGELAPSTLDTWMKMPTGPTKAKYLRDHPELQSWFSRGPMSNMPDSYKEIVRDIMVNYGLWSEKQDPLSNTLSEYFKLPRSEQGGYLDKHPEIVEYWRALVPDEEKHLFDLQQSYYAQDEGPGRRAFLETHPELKDYFVTQRERRYERFLNRVSFYLGSNPEAFQMYLKDQTLILKMLLDRYGERPMTAENIVTRTRHRRAAA